MEKRVSFADPMQSRGGGAVRYIGSKARVVGQILEIVGPPTPSDAYFVDGFAGTGVVAARAADLGWRVRVNDQLRSAAVVSRARLVADDDVPFAQLGGYTSAIEAVNAAEPLDGFFWREYSPAGERMYFTENNGRKIDGIRCLLNSWRTEGLLSEEEGDLLAADLIAAVNRVANIAGTYGHFLSHWTRNAKREIGLETRELRAKPVQHEVFNVDVVDLAIGEGDVAYFDPPYTKRQYAAYYHVLETIACGDDPTIVGKSGLRPWRDNASDYCYKVRALRALSVLIAGTAAHRVLLSYSSEGHVALDDLREVLEPQGRVTIHELTSIGRYRPNRQASAAGNDVTEYVVELEKSDASSEALVKA